MPWTTERVREHRLEAGRPEMRVAMAMVMVMVVMLFLRATDIALRVPLVTIPVTPASVLLGLFKIMRRHLRMRFVESMEQPVGSIKVQRVQETLPPLVVVMVMVVVIMRASHRRLLDMRASHRRLLGMRAI